MVFVQQPAWEIGPHLKEEEFTRAIALGLLDYLRKSRSRGFVVSISGGADSAGVSCLVGALVQLGVGELGHDAFREKLDYIPDSTVTDADEHGGEAATSELLQEHRHGASSCVDC